MAALHICHCLNRKGSSSSSNHIQPRNGPRNVISISCIKRESSDPEEGKKEKKAGNKIRSLPQVLVSIDSFGKALGDRMSPKHKGDWKDLTYMSLSFALYIYISQKLVCTYCAWMSITKQPW